MTKTLTPKQEAKLIEQGLTPFYWGAAHTISAKDGKRMTAREALEAAALDFTVAKVPGGAFVQGVSKSGKPARHFVKAENQFYTLREDTNQILGSVKGRYRVLQNVDAFQFAQDIIGTDEARIAAVGSVKHGRKTFLVLDLLNTAVGGKVGEGITPQLVLVNDHAGDQSVTGFITMKRIACNNMLAYAMAEAPNVFRVRHTATMESKLDVTSGREALDLVVDYAAEFERVMGDLLKRKMSKAKVEEFVRDVLNPLPTDAEGNVQEFAKDGKRNRGVTVAMEVQDAILDIYHTAENIAPIRGTAYGVLNAVSEYYQHHTEGRVTRGEEEDAEQVKAENRFDRLMGGQGLDHKAFRLLTEG